MDWKNRINKGDRFLDKIKTKKAKETTTTTTTLIKPYHKRRVY